MEILKWLLHTAILLAVFNFFIMPVVHWHTRNRWSKFPIFVFLSVPSGLFMAWLSYVPFILFIIWISFNYHTLKAMEEEKFIKESNLIINKPLFWISTYLYITLTCGLAVFLQTELVTGEERVLLWKHLLGIAG